MPLGLKKKKKESMQLGKMLPDDRLTFSEMRKKF